MRKYPVLVGIVTVVLALVFAQAAVMAQCGPCDGNPNMVKAGKGPHGQAGAGSGMRAQGAGAGSGCCMAGMQGCPMAGGGMGHGRGMGMVGPIQVNPESQKLWKDLELLQVKRHRAMWDLFRLVGADEVDQGAVQAKQKELWTLNQDMIAAYQGLAKFQAEPSVGCPQCPPQAGASCACPECAGKNCKCCTGGECTCGADCKCACCAEGGNCPGKPRGCRMGCGAAS